MEITTKISKKGRGNQLVNAERAVLISKMVDKLSEGYMSTNELSKQLGVSRVTIDSYRGLVDDLIGKTKVDRNVILRLQIQRTYKLIEMLMQDLKEQRDKKDMAGNSFVDIKNTALLYNQIYKFSSHLAQITGLNIETHVNVDPTKLVIIRSNQKKSDVIEANAD